MGEMETGRIRRPAAPSDSRATKRSGARRIRVLSERGRSCTPALPATSRHQRAVVPRGEDEWTWNPLSRPGNSASLQGQMDTRKGRARFLPGDLADGSFTKEVA